MANPSKVLGTVVEVSTFGEGIFLVRFFVGSRYTRFLPGQFLHLTLDPFDSTLGYWPESRVFSIASRPRQDDVIIVYSVKGSYTQRMSRELVVGRKVWLKLPYGDFVISQSLLEAGPVILIAGGTGVAPFLPFLVGFPSSAGTVHLFYGARHPSNILFKEELASLLDKPWFNLHLMVESPGEIALPHESGRLSVEKVGKVLGPELQDCNVFISGPPSMIQQFRSDLLEMNLPTERIHIDSWE